MVPFSVKVTGSITSVDISGTRPSAEVLVKVNMDEFTDNGDTLGDEPNNERVLVKAEVLGIVFCSTVIFHLKKVSVVVHVTSSWPPLHTDAISEGDTVITPE